MIVTVVKRLQEVLGMVAIVFIILMMLTTVVDVSGRYLFNSPISGSLEFARSMLVIVVSFTLGYAQLRKQHIRAEILPHHLSPRLSMVVEGFALILALGFSGLVTYGTFMVAYKSIVQIEYESGLINFPLWPARIALAIGCLALTLQYLVDTVQVFRSSSSQ